MEFNLLTIYWTGWDEWTVTIFDIHWDDKKIWWGLFCFNFACYAGLDWSLHLFNKQILSWARMTK